MTKTILLFTLCASTCCGAERYFTSGPQPRHAAVGYLLDDASERTFVRREPNVELDVTLDFEQLEVTIHTATWSFPRIPVWQLDDDLDFELSIALPAETVLPLTLDEFGQYGTPTICVDLDNCSPSERPIEGTIDLLLSMSRLGQTFEVRGVDMKEGADFTFWAEPDNRVCPGAWTIAKTLASQTTCLKIGLDFWSPFDGVDVGGGKVVDVLSVGLRYRIDDVQRVPTPAQRAGYLPGDADLDGEVTFADFLALSSHYGRRGTWGHGDFNGDFEVDFSDYLALSDGFGSVHSLSVRIPEPDSRRLMVVALIAFAVIHVINQE